MCRFENLNKKFITVMLKIFGVEVMFGKIAQQIVTAELLFFMYKAAIMSSFADNTVKKTCGILVIYVILTVMHFWTKYLEDCKKKLEETNRGIKID